MKRNCLHLAAIAGFTALLCTASPASAQGPSTGAAQSFAVLGGTAVTVAGTGTVITGDVGVSPGTSITGIPAGGTVDPPFGVHANDTAAINAQASATSLYTTLATTGGATPIVPELGLRTLGPGVYSFTSTANIAAATTLTLSGAGTYIFQVGSSLTANVGSNVFLINGASPCNVFWQVGSAATLNGGIFAGTVVAQAGVTLGVNASLSGRALATSAGPVTLSGNNRVGGCSTSANGCPTITMAPSTLPNGRVAVAYNQPIVASGGAAPYTFSVTAGALPAGLTLSAAGVISGTPTTIGSSAFVITARDSNGCLATTNYVLVVQGPLPVCPAITLAPPTLPNAVVGAVYGQTIVASGGTAPYTFAVTVGTLPAGLTLTSGGVLGGTPTAAGTFDFTIRATDANGCTVSVAYSIIVAPAPAPPPVCPAITLTPPTMPNAVVGVAYEQTIIASGGTAPYTFASTAGTLPPGLTLTPGGVLGGTPTAAGTFNFTIRATDANGCLVSVAYTIVVAPAPAPPPVCPPFTFGAAPPNGTVGVPYSHTISVTGGTAPFTFGVTTGTLPPGLALTSFGVIQGTPTTVGSSTFTIRRTDSTGCFADASFTVVIGSVVDVPTLPQAFVVLLALGLTAAGYLRLRRRTGRADL